MSHFKTTALFTASLVCGVIGLHFGYSATDVTAQDGISAHNPFTGVETGSCANDDIFTVVIHGGSISWRGGNHAPKIPDMQTILQHARSLLASGARAIDVAEASIASMENSGLFNAGKGAIANQAGVIELDASIMDGRNLQAGAVAAVRNARNPIVAARLVMDKSENVMFVGPNADRFIEQNDGGLVDIDYFLHGGQNFSDVPLPDDISISRIDDEVEPQRAGFLGIWGGVFDGNINHVLVIEKVDSTGANVVYALGRHPAFGNGLYRRLRGDFVDDVLHIKEPQELGGFKLTYRLNPDNTLAVKGTHPDFPDGAGTMTRQSVKPGIDDNSGTVGAVVRDRCGDLAAGTSTGGFDSKIPGRVGDSPIIGAGTYADNATAAVSATGHGEYFMRHVVAYDITAAMKYKGLALDQVASNLIKTELLARGLRGGVIAVDKDGNYVMTFNTQGMARGVATHTDEPRVKIY